MESSVYAIEEQVKRTHWWFVNRRELFLRWARSCTPSPDTSILDVGASTGGTMQALAKNGYRNLTGLELNPEAVSYCRERGLANVLQGDVSSMPFDDKSFDFIIAGDVLEHVDDDVGALAEMRRVLAPGGRIVITVPAFKFLWSNQDDIAHHKRRYTMRQIRGRIGRAGLNTATNFYFNYLLFVPIFLTRLAFRALGLHVENENTLTPGWINGVLRALFRLDILTAPYVRPPFGVSIFALAERPSETESVTDLS